MAESRHPANGHRRQHVVTHRVGFSALAIHLIRREHIWKALSQRAPRLVAKVAVIGVSVLVGKVIFANDLRRTAGKQRSDDGVIVGVVVTHDLC